MKIPALSGFPSLVQISVQGQKKVYEVSHPPLDSLTQDRSLRPAASARGAYDSECCPPRPPTPMTSPPIRRPERAARDVNMVERQKPSFAADNQS